MIDYIELSIPARADLLHLVRLTAGVVAARLDLDLDDVEDLRLGVEELCLSLVGSEGHAPGRLALRYGWDHEEIEITCTLIDVNAGNGDLADEGRDRPPAGSAGFLAGQDEALRQELSSHILDALVDGHGGTRADGHASAWLRMRRSRGSIDSGSGEQA
jgi:hypothetical protein